MAKKKAAAAKPEDPRLIQLRELGVELEAAKQECAAARDKLRRLLSRYSDIVDCFTEADEDLVLAKDYLDSAVERMSELV